MTYLRWMIDKDIAGRLPDGIVELYTEVDDAGRVSREVGLDDRGNVVHRAPSSRHPYGLFDNQMIQSDGHGDITHEAFERLWQLAPS